MSEPRNDHPRNAAHWGRCKRCKRLTWVRCDNELCTEPPGCAFADNCADCGQAISAGEEVHFMGTSVRCPECHRIHVADLEPQAAKPVRRYLDEYAPPVRVRRPCAKCGYILGLQNPGDTCDSCKSL